MTTSATVRRAARLRPCAGLRTVGSSALLLPALALLAIAFLYPVIAILTRSFTQPAAAGEGTFADYSWLFSSHTNIQVLLRTLVNAGEVAGICLLIGYPYAYTMTLVSGRMRLVMAGAVLVPFWTSATVRNYAWLILLQKHGAVNYLLHHVGLGGVDLLGTQTAVLVGECYVMLPFMILPLYAVVSGINRRLLDASASLGARPQLTFASIYLPLSLGGIIAGVVIVFTQALGFYLTPAILGSVGNSTMLPQLIVTQVNTLLDWGRGGALSLLLLVAVSAGMGTVSAVNGRQRGGQPLRGEFGPATSSAGAASSGQRALKPFSALVAAALILPALIVFPMGLTSTESFQFPPPGWSLRWYRAFFTSHAWLVALLHSVVISLIVVVLASILGTAAALALARGRVHGRPVAVAILFAPMVVPTVITAVGVYLVALKFHLVSTYLGFVLVYTCLALPMVVIPVLSRLRAYDTRIDWASASLGANRLTTLRTVTLPLIGPALLSGAIFAFVTAFDETVVALFMVGPSLHTFPVQIFEGVLQTIDPTVAAASSVLLVFTTCVLVATGILTRRRSARGL